MVQVRNSPQSSSKGLSAPLVWMIVSSVLVLVVVLAHRTSQQAETMEPFMDLPQMIPRLTSTGYPLNIDIKPITGASEAALEALGESQAAPGMWTCPKTYSKDEKVRDLAIDETYKLPVSTKNDIEKHKQFLLSTKTGKESINDVVEPGDEILLHHIVSQKCKHAIKATGSCVTVETGFALAGSAISILDAHENAYNMAGASKRTTHYAIDPLQQQNYKNVGARGVSRYLADNPKSPVDFYLLNETAALSLAYFTKARKCFDVIFLDDGHRFDQNIIELSLAVDLTAVGSVIMMHDTYLPSIKATKSWIETNLNQSLKVVEQGIAWKTLVLIKIAHDERKWDHFEPFQSEERAKNNAEQAAAKKKVIDGK